MPARPAHQLTLDLPHRVATGRDDFLVSGANEAAVAAVDAWPEWPSPVLILVGTAGSGKSHLCDVWCTRADARIVAASALETSAVADLMRTGAVAVEDAPGDGFDEVAMFHLINLARETSGSILITSEDYPSRWNVALPDLVSRLKAAQVASLGDPDDELLRGLLVKQFADRQLHVDEAAISYMVLRMERSFEAARSLVAKIDARALADRAEITRNFVARVMQDNAEPDMFEDD
ncbi:MAG: DnaA/Hda family protein [Anderseniella sp.]